MSSFDSAELSLSDIVEVNHYDGICDRCEGIKFDTDGVVDAIHPERPDIDNYGFVPLSYVLEDDFPWLPKLTTSIQFGCEMCQFVEGVIWSHVRSCAEIPELASYAMRRGADGVIGPDLGMSLRLMEYHPDLSTIRRHEERDQWRPGFIHGHVCVGNTKKAITIGVRDVSVGWYTGFPSYDPLSEHSTKLVQGWIESCRTKRDSLHKQCPSLRQAAAPNRLLNVMDGDTVRLEPTEGITLQYAILSYCWGTSKSVESARTVISNLPARLRGFPLASLPQTLQDSIILVRRLGISYVWIDALCIVQDSGEWIVESRWMMQYYENAYLTVVPIACSSADQPFLKNRPLFVSKDIYRIEAGEPELQYHFPVYKGVQEEFSLAPWLSRGWTFQERLLSARTLFVGKEEMMFQCRAGFANESRGAHVTPSRGLSDFMPLSYAEAASSDEWKSLELVRLKWYQFIGHYAGLKFSRESDRLLALSGIASKFADIVAKYTETMGVRNMGVQDMGVYMDGFWRSDLWHGLSWRLQQGKLGKSQAIGKSALFPSWSWCSINRPLSWNDGTGWTSDAELLEVIKDPSHSWDGSGPKVTGLVIKTWMFPLHLLTTTLPPGSRVESHFDDATMLADNVSGHNGLKALVLTANFGVEDDSWTDDPFDKPHNVSGMIIAPKGTTHGKHGAYRRLGAFDILIDTEFAMVEDTTKEQDDLVFEFDEFPVRGHEFESTSAGWMYKQIYARRGTVALM